MTSKDKTYNDLTLRMTALTYAIEAMDAGDTSADYKVTDLAHWIYDWIKEGVENDSTVTQFKVVN